MNLTLGCVMSGGRDQPTRQNCEPNPTRGGTQTTPVEPITRQLGAAIREGARGVSLNSGRMELIGVSNAEH